MTTQKPKFAVLGNLSADLAEEISAAVEIQLPTCAVEEIDGLLIDGLTATPDLATLKQHLDAGKILTFHQPTDEHLSSILKLVGFAPGSGIPMVSCFKNPKNQLYTVVKGTAVAQNSKADHTGITVQQPSLAGHLTGALTELNNPPPLVSGLVPYGPTFSTSTWGALRVVEADPSTTPILVPTPAPDNVATDGGDTICDAANFPSGVNVPKTDDRTWYGHGDGQPGAGVYLYADYYVYWTSGDNGSGQPYFYVVRYDNGTFYAGAPISMNRDAVGYCSGMWQLVPVGMTPPNSSTPTLPSFQNPSGYLDGSNPISVSAPNVPINFFVNNPQGGGLASITWTPGSNQQGQIVPVATLNLSGWYITQGEDSSLIMSQKDGWDMNSMYWTQQNWTSFYHLLFAQDGWNNNAAIIGANFPQLSGSKIPFSNVWGWQFYASAKSGDGVTTAYVVPDSYPISITLSPWADFANTGTAWIYTVFFLHGQNNCYSTNSGPHVWAHYFCSFDEALSKLDLAAIVNHKVTLSN